MSIFNKGSQHPDSKAQQDADTTIGFIDVLCAAATLLVQQGTTTWQGVANVMDTVIAQQANQDDGTRPARHTVPALIKAFAEAQMHGEEANSRPALRLVSGDDDGPEAA